MASQAVGWHEICCLHYEGCLTIKWERKSLLCMTVKMYTKCLPICLRWCLWVYVRGSCFLQRWHICIKCAITCLSRPSVTSCEMRRKQEDFNCNLQRCSHCWIHPGPNRASPSHFQSFDGSCRSNWGCIGVVCLPQVVNNNKAYDLKL